MDRVPAKGMRLESQTSLLQGGPPPAAGRRGGAAASGGAALGRRSARGAEARSHRRVVTAEEDETPGSGHPHPTALPRRDVDIEHARSRAVCGTMSRFTQTMTSPVLIPAGMVPNRIWVMTIVCTRGSAASAAGTNIRLAAAAAAAAQRRLLISAT